MVRWRKVTIDDYIFTYEGIGHKDYTGVRYDGDFKILKEWMNITKVLLQQSLV